MSRDRATLGAALCLGLAALAWGGLPELLSRIPVAEPGPGPRWIAGVAALVAVSTAVFLSQSLRSFGVRRVEDRPTSTARSLAAGAAELDGHAGDATLIAPLTDTPCVYWDYTIWTRDHDDTLTRVVMHSSSAWPLPLVDATGSVWLDLQGAALTPGHAEQIEVEAGRPADPRVARFLDLHGVAPTGRAVLQERRIEAGDPLFARGAGLARAERDAAAERVRAIVAAGLALEEVGRDDASRIEDAALACASRDARRRLFEREIERRLEADGDATRPLDPGRLETIRSEARRAAEHALHQRHRRFARWILASRNARQRPDELALAAHVAGSLPAPDQGLLVGPRSDPPSPLVLRSTSERALLDKDRHTRVQLLALSGGVAAGGLLVGAAIDGARFALAAFGLTCVAIPFAGAVWLGLQSRWGLDLQRLYTPTEDTRPGL